MQVRYSVPEDQDKPVYEAAEERPEKPIRIRLQPDVFRANEGERGLFMAWRGVHWTVECETPGEAVALKEGLKAFFDLCSLAGVDDVRQTLIKIATSAGPTLEEERP